MAIVKKISELTAKGSNLGVTDLLIVGVSNGVDYDLKSVTGAQLMGTAVVQTITNGDTSHASSSDALFDALALKVDTVVGSRLITSAESTVLSNTSGTNTGDENITTIKSKLGITTLSGSNTGDQGLQSVTDVSATTTKTMISDNGTYRGTLAPTTIISGLQDLSYYSSIDADGKLQLKSNGTNIGVLKATNLTAEVTLEFPNKAVGTYTVATTSDFSGTNTGDQTFLDARLQTVTSSATVTPVSTNDLVIITAQSTGLTLANPTGTFTEGQALMIRIKDNGTARTIAFDTNYRAIGVTLPTTTVISKTMYLGIIYNSTDSKWDIVGLNQQS